MISQQVQDFLTSWGLHFDTPDGESTNIPYPQIYDRMQEDAGHEGGLKLKRFISSITDTTDGQTYLTVVDWNEMTDAWFAFEKREEKSTPLTEDFHKFEALVKETTEKLRVLRKSQEHMRWQFGDPEWYQDFVNELNDTKEGWVSSNC